MNSNKNKNAVILSVAGVALACSSSGSTFVDAFAPSPTVRRNQPTSHQRSLSSNMSPLHSFAIMDSDATMSAIDSFFQSQPYMAAFLACSFKASAADMVAQSQEDKAGEGADSTLTMTTSAAAQQEEGSWFDRIRNEPAAAAAAEEAEGMLTSMAANIGSAVSSVDFSRNVGFVLHGGLYTGIWQNYLYTVLYPSWFSMDEGWTLVVKEVAIDNAIFGPLLCLPLAYACKTACISGDFTAQSFREGLDKYVDDIMLRGILTKYWMIWIPVQFLTFGVVPPHFRSVFVALFSFFWICLLSAVSSSTDEADATNSTIASTVAEARANAAS